MDADAAEFCVNIARDCAIIVPKSGSQAGSGGFTVALEVVADGGEGKVLGRAAQLSQQEVLRLAQVEKVLDGSAIFLRELPSMGAVERLCLLEWGNLLVGDEELEVAAIVVRHDQDLVARRLDLPSFDG